MEKEEFKSEFEAALTLWSNAGKVSFREVLFCYMHFNAPVILNMPGALIIIKS